MGVGAEQDSGLGDRPDALDGSAEHRSGAEDPRRTGVPEVDAAVADLAELRDAPLTEHHDRLAQAQAALSQALSGPGANAPEVSGGQDDPARP